MWNIVFINYLCPKPSNSILAIPKYSDLKGCVRSTIMWNHDGMYKFSSHHDKGIVDDGRWNWVRTSYISSIWDNILISKSILYFSFLYQECEHCGMGTSGSAYFAIGMNIAMYRLSWSLTLSHKLVVSSKWLPLLTGEWCLDPTSDPAFSFELASFCWVNSSSYTIGN